MYYINFNDNKEYDLNSLNDLFKIKKPHRVKSIHIIDSNIKKLDIDIFNNFRNLQVLYLNYNDKLTNLDKDIFKYNIQLKKLSLISSKITELDKDIFKYNTQLIELNLSYNKLENLDKDIFKYNTQLKHLYLISNYIKELDSDIFKYNIQLIELNLSNNKLENLDKDIFKYNTQLTQLYISNNEISNINKDIFKYNTELKYLYLNYNKLTELDKNIFANLTQLEYLYISNNKLTELDKDIFKNNIKLLYLHLPNNNFSNLDKDIFVNLIKLLKLYLYNNNFSILDKDIFKYNIQLNTLCIQNNKITNLDKDIFTNLKQLEILVLSYNKLTNIPTSILFCRRLNYINYDNNEIEYIPPYIKNFFNKLKQQSENLQVYNDTQNIHNHQIQESVKNSLENILNIPKVINKELLLDNLVQSKIIGETSIQLLLEYCADESMHSILNITFEEALLHILEYINLECLVHKEEIYKILGEEIVESECKCFTGRISRLINCLNGFTPLVEVKIPENMELSNIIVMIKNNYNGDSIEELKELVRKELLERGYEEELINEYVEYIELD
jgi:Leucine-rich repeat (LRR) protein